MRFDDSRRLKGLLNPAGTLGVSRAPAARRSSSKLRPLILRAGRALAAAALTEARALPLTGRGARALVEVVALGLAELTGVELFVLELADEDAELEAAADDEAADDEPAEDEAAEDEAAEEEAAEEEAAELELGRTGAASGPGAMPTVRRMVSLKLESNALRAGVS